jgi:hypothetical protein
MKTVINWYAIGATRNCAERTEDTVGIKMSLQPTFWHCT